MIFKPKQLGKEAISAEALAEDKKSCRRFGPCGVGKKAIYLNSFYIERHYYLPLDSVTRVFKRVAMSKGGFSGKGAFATMPYLVVEYDGGKQKQCNFKYEEQVDQLLAYVKSMYPRIRTHSAEAEKRLAEKERARAQKRAVRISDEAKQAVRELESASSYLEKRPSLHLELSAAAKKKRTYDRSNPAYKWVAFFITLLGIAALVYGIYAVVTHAGMALYFLLFGLAVLFLFSSANVLPTAKNNRRAIEKRLREAVEAMEQYVSRMSEFPVPARYAHPVVLKRMEDILLEGRAQTVDQAFELLKSDLKALNSSVTVEQEEYDEIMAIKPMFLVMDYQ